MASEVVELVDENGSSIGSMPTDAAHRSGGVLHRAYSVFLRNSAGEVLLQRRARRKSRFPALWSNACCGHPAPGADLQSSAAARVWEELGVEVVDLVERGAFVYRADDPSSEFSEHEFDHVLVGRLDRAPDPDPAEVADVRWVSIETILAEIALESHRYTPWFRRAMAVGGLAEVGT